MSKDYKNETKRPSGGNNRSDYLNGLLLGLLLGISIAVGIILYITQSSSPFTRPSSTSAEPKEATPTTPKQKPAATPATESTTRFDFYKILPANGSGETPASTEPAVPKTAPKNTKNLPNTEPATDTKSLKTPPVASEHPRVYYLQVGSYKSEQEVDKIKAKLAFLGFESSSKMVMQPDQTLQHRVRIGPFDEAQVRDMAIKELKNNGFNPITIIEKP